MILMFMGEYHHNIDEKGRLTLPSKFRSDLENKFVVTRGLEKCLFVYTLETFEKLTVKLNSLPFTKKDARNFSRFFLSGATVLEFDKQGRVNLTPTLIKYAELTKECVIIGVGDRLEIWNDSNWNLFLKENETNLSDIAENLFNDSLDVEL